MFQRNGYTPTMRELHAYTEAPGQLGLGSALPASWTYGDRHHLKHLSERHDRWWEAVPVLGLDNSQKQHDFQTVAGLQVKLRRKVNRGAPEICEAGRSGLVGRLERWQIRRWHAQASPQARRLVRTSVNEKCDTTARQNSTIARGLWHRQALACECLDYASGVQAILAPATQPYVSNKRRSMS